MIVLFLYKYAWCKFLLGFSIYFLVYIIAACDWSTEHEHKGAFDYLHCVSLLHGYSVTTRSYNK